MKKKKTELSRSPIVVPIINGVGYSGQYVCSLAVTTDNGDIKVVAKRYKKKRGSSFFLFRGLAFLIYGVINFFAMLRESLHISEQNLKKDYIENKIANQLNVPAKYVFVSIISVIGIILGFISFILIPKQIIMRINLENTFFKQFILALLKVLFLYLFFLIIRLLPLLNTFFKLNCAGNLIITKNKQMYYSLNFLNYLINSFLICFFVLPLINFNINYFFQIIINIFAIFLIFSLNFEFLKLLSQQKFVLSKIYVRMSSWLVIVKPTNVEKEIAEAGFMEFVMMNANNERQNIESEDKKVSLSAVIVETKNALKNIDDADNEALWLIALCLNKNKLDLKLIQSITKDAQLAIRKATERRVNNEPLSKIFGKTNFFGREFVVDKNVLAPRVETELVVENAINLVKTKKMKTALDLCTGSGIIAVCLAKETEAKVVAVDLSRNALVVAEKNALRNQAKIQLICSDMFKGLKKKMRFDIIVSNPPYLKTEEIAIAPKEVKDYDPKMALDGGEDGLVFYREIANEAPKFLTGNGYLILEIGYQQAEMVKELLKKDFENIRIKKDYFGNDRIVVAKKKESVNARKDTKTKR